MTLGSCESVNLEKSLSVLKGNIINPKNIYENIFASEKGEKALKYKILALCAKSPQEKEMYQDASDALLYEILPKPVLPEIHMHCTGGGTG